MFRLHLKQQFLDNPHPQAVFNLSSFIVRISFIDGGARQPSLHIDQVLSNLWVEGAERILYCYPDNNMVESSGNQTHDD